MILKLNAFFNWIIQIEIEINWETSTDVHLTDLQLCLLRFSTARFRSFFKLRMSSPILVIRCDFNLNKNWRLSIFSRRVHISLCTSQIVPRLMVQASSQKLSCPSPPSISLTPRNLRQRRVDSIRKASIISHMTMFSTKINAIMHKLMENVKVDRTRSIIIVTVPRKYIHFYECKRLFKMNFSWLAFMYLNTQQAIHSKPNINGVVVMFSNSNFHFNVIQCNCHFNQIELILYANYSTSLTLSNSLVLALTHSYTLCSAFICVFSFGFHM